MPMELGSRYTCLCVIRFVRSIESAKKEVVKALLITCYSDIINIVGELCLYLLFYVILALVVISAKYIRR